MTNEFAFRIFSSGINSIIYIGPAANKPAIDSGSPAIIYPANRKDYTIMYLDEDTMTLHILQRNADTGAAVSWT